MSFVVVVAVLIVFYRRLITLCVCVQEPRFVSGEEKAFKLVDLKDFTVYSDSELFGELEGQALVVSVCVCGW